MTSAPVWNADAYGQHGRFISRMGLELLQWLDPGQSETILDAGCGDGFVTQRLAGMCDHVIGIDASPDMIAAARAKGLDARCLDIATMPFEGHFDAVFSNSVLQWISNPSPAIGAIARALKPGGRFVADLGALGNLAAVLTALGAAGQKHGGNRELANPFFAPTGDEFSSLLKRYGFIIDRLEVEPRITPAETSLMNWISTIFHPFFDQFDDSIRSSVRSEVENLLKPVLCDTGGRWYVDHVRLRVRATMSG